MVRDYQPGDKAALNAIHEAQGLDYKMPDLDQPLYFVKKVKVDGGKVVAALVLKICAETMLLIDPEQEPQEKLTEMQELQSSVLNEAYRQGLDEVIASIPEIGFDKRLIQLGWIKDRPGWNLWSRSTLDARSS
jgi:hypothetical protein